MIVVSETSKNHLVVKFHNQYLFVGCQQWKVVKDVVPISQFNDQWQDFQKYVTAIMHHRLVGRISKKSDIFFWIASKGGGGAYLYCKSGDENDR